MKRFDLLIFDWDGTLADSAAQIVAGMQKAIVELKLPARSDRQIRELIGLSFYDAMGRLFPEFSAAQAERLMEDYRRQLIAGGHQAAGPAEAPLFEGALEALQGLHAGGYRLAIATGKSRGSLKRSFVKHPGLHVLIASSRCADETAPKPDPLMLRELLEVEAVDAARALMIGDTEYDMEMARALGMPALGVSCGVHEAERLSAAGALGLIAQVADLPRWLGTSL